ncbi:1,4-alpha-glucan branching protein [Streptomyces sp. NPDC048483]|uniref:maltokinase N-terminal cap-like domain-containing protein n=1 Tax=Streptomyces sp. NPDC048483 TaxID=3154927 RepID=UPI00342C7DA9
MAVIHHVTLTPGKLELLTAWLPGQPWYLGRESRTPELSKAGGFRLDDPQGAVGIEFMVVSDGSGDRPVTYLVPLTYRGAPLDGAGHALVGTTEHGVLGRRWVFDGTHDPVLVAQLVALIRGEAEPQDQNVSDAVDRSVTRDFTETGDAAGHAAVAGSTVVASGPDGTDLVVETGTGVASGPGDRPGGRLAVRVHRVLEAHHDASATGAARIRGHVTAGWRLPDGTEGRGPFAVVR